MGSQLAVGRPQVFKVGDGVTRSREAYDAGEVAHVFSRATRIGHSCQMPIAGRRARLYVPGIVVTAAFCVALDVVGIVATVIVVAPHGTVVFSRLPPRTRCTRHRSVVIHFFTQA